MTELKPCPFCGADNIKILSNGIGDYFATCYADEDAFGCGARSSDYRCESKEQAAERWNTRPSPTPDATITSTVERMQEALKQIEGGSFVGADGYAIKGDWHGFAQHLQNIARRALAPMSATQEGVDNG